MKTEIPQSRAHLHTFYTEGSTEVCEDDFEEVCEDDFEFLVTPSSERERRSFGKSSNKFMESLKLLKDAKKDVQ